MILRFNPEGFINLAVELDTREIYDCIYKIYGNRDFNKILTLNNFSTSDNDIEIINNIQKCSNTALSLDNLVLFDLFLNLRNQLADIYNRKNNGQKSAVMNAEQLGSVRNLGRKGYNEVIAKLHEVGLDIRKETL